MIENSWFYYFSSLAQTIAACSALLVVLAIIRLQYLDNALNMIERSLAEVFFNIAEQDNYRRQVFIHFLNEKWHVYFDSVQELAEKNHHKFATSGDYTHSKVFLDSLIEHGRRLEARNRHLHRAMAFAFAGTVAFAGIAILAIPVAQWISTSVLLSCWAISGVLLIILFAKYLLLVNNTLTSKEVEKSK